MEKREAGNKEVKRNHEGFWVNCLSKSVEPLKAIDWGRAIFMWQIPWVLWVVCE